MESPFEDVVVVFFVVVVLVGVVGGVVVVVDEVVQVSLTPVSKFSWESEASLSKSVSSPVDTIHVFSIISPVTASTVHEVTIGVPVREK